jgi:hypothetical protein
MHRVIRRARRPTANTLPSVPANFCACPEIFRPEIVLLLRNGTVEGKIRGGFLTGVVKDESGEVAARFTGRIEPDGSMTGTYTDRTGEVGSWRWPDSAQGRQAEE